MRLWLDDIREPPDTSWIWVQSVADAKFAMKSLEVTELSFANELGPSRAPASDLVWWMFQRGLWPRDLIAVHSAERDDLDQIASILCERGPFERVPGTGRFQHKFA